MRALAVAAVVAGLAAGSCGEAGSDQAAVAAVDQFCASFAGYRGAKEALATTPAADPRRLQARLGGVEPPPALAGAWKQWRDREQATIAAGVAQAAHGRRPFWIVAAPEHAPSAVDTFWEAECVAARGYQVPLLVSETDPDLPPHHSPPDGGEIRVVEHGFTAGTGTDGGDEVHVVSYGIVVENTSDFVAVGTSVRVRMSNEEGRQVGPYGGGSAERQHTIPVLLPGQRFGLGGERWLDRAGTAQLTVVVDETAGWWPVDHDMVGFPGMVTSDVAIDPYDGGALFVRFRIDSAYRVRFGGLVPEPARTPYVVLRDADGEIVGGGDHRGQWDVPPGHSEGTLVINEIPILELGSEVDPARTEVYF